MQRSQIQSAPVHETNLLRHLADDRGTVKVPGCRFQIVGPRARGSLRTTGHKFAGSAMQDEAVAVE